MGNRFMRCVAKYIQWRAVAIREPEDAMAAALASYWEKEARKKGIKMDDDELPPPSWPSELGDTEGDPEPPDRP